MKKVVIPTVDEYAQKAGEEVGGGFGLIGHERI